MVKHRTGSIPVLGTNLFGYKLYIAGWSSLVARRAHNPKVVGSNPAPATKNKVSVHLSVKPWYKINKALWSSGLRHHPFTVVSRVRFPAGSPFIWAHSSVGRAPALQAGGHRFEPYCAHQIIGLVVQLVRMPACHAGGRRFEPDPGRQFNFR